MRYLWCPERTLGYAIQSSERSRLSGSHLSGQLISFLWMSFGGVASRVGAALTIAFKSKRYERMTLDMSTDSAVSQWIAAFNAHDVARIVSLYHDNAELDDAGMKHPRRGKQAIEDWFTQRFQTMPSITYTPHEYVCETEVSGVVTWTTRSKSPIPGRKRWLAWLSRSFEVDGVSVFMLRDGLIVKQRGYYDHLAVIQQILPPLKYLLPVRF